MSIVKQLGRTAMAAALLAGATTLASAADFGALVTNDSTFTGNKASELELDQKNTASAWLRIPFNNAGTTYFTVEGLYQFERTPINISKDDDVGDAENQPLFDVDLAKFAASAGAGAGTFSLALGRFSTSDLTGIIYNQNADGALLSFESPVFALSLYGAYTGLLNARAVSMLDDITEEDTEKLYQLATKYAIGSATLSLPHFAAGQTLSAQFLGTFRLEDEDFNRMYATLALNGPLSTRLFYTLSSTLGISSYADEDKEYSNLSKASLTLYTGVKGITFTANGVYASGEQGPFKSFTGFTSQTAVKALSDRTEYTGLIKGGLGMSIKPFASVLLSGGCEAILTALDTSIEYEGFQYQAALGWQVVSDVSLSASIYQYYDKENSERDKTGINLYAAISF